MTAPPEPSLRLSHACKRLGVSRRHGYRLVRANLLKAGSIEGRRGLWVSCGELARFMAASMVDENEASR